MKTAHAWSRVSILGVRMTDRQRFRQETTDARAQAAALLTALTQAQGGAGATDLYKRVTGASSLENAIAETRRTIDAYDRLLAEFDKPAPVVVTTLRPIASPVNPIARLQPKAATA